MSGKEEETPGGLRKEHMTRNKKGRIVSKNLSEKARKSKHLSAWRDAVAGAIAKLLEEGEDVPDFAIPKKDTRLYTEAKALYEKFVDREKRSSKRTSRSSR